MEFIALLQSTLANLDLVSVDARSQGTWLISEAILGLSSVPGTKVEAEVRVEGFKREGSDRGGIIDFLVEYRGHRYAIEVDSSNKRGSLSKLMYLADQEHTAIWVRWAYPVTIEIPKNIYLLDFTNPNKKRR